MRQILTNWEELQNKTLSEFKEDPGAAFHSVLGIRTNYNGLPYDDVIDLFSDIKKFFRKRSAVRSSEKYLIFHDQYLKKKLEKEYFQFLFLGNIDDKQRTCFRTSKEMNHFLDIKRYMGMEPSLAAENDVPHVIKGSLLFWYIVFAIGAMITMLFLLLHVPLMSHKFLLLFNLLIPLLMIFKILISRGNRRRKIRRQAKELLAHKFLENSARKDEVFSYRQDIDISLNRMLYEEETLVVTCSFLDFNKEGCVDEKTKEKNYEVLKKAAALAAKLKGQIFYLVVNTNGKTSVEINYPSKEKDDTVFNFFIAEIGVKTGNCIILFKDWIPHPLVDAEKVPHPYVSGRHINTYGIHAFAE